MLAWSIARLKPSSPPRKPEELYATVFGRLERIKALPVGCGHLCGVRNMRYPQFVHGWATDINDHAVLVRMDEFEPGNRGSGFGRNADRRVSVPHPDVAFLGVQP